MDRSKGERRAARRPGDQPGPEGSGATVLAALEPAKAAYEIGRRDKKIADQEKELARLRGMLVQANAGNRETQAVVDATLTAVVLAYGETVCLSAGPEAAVGKGTGGKMSGLCPLGRSGGCGACGDAGKRLEVPVFGVKEMRERYEIHCRRDEKANTYVLGIAPREEGSGNHRDHGGDKK